MHGHGDLKGHFQPNDSMTSCTKEYNHMSLYNYLEEKKRF